MTLNLCAPPRHVYTERIQPRASWMSTLPTELRLRLLPIFTGPQTLTYFHRAQTFLSSLYLSFDLFFSPRDSFIAVLKIELKSLDSLIKQTLEKETPFKQMILLPQFFRCCLSSSVIIMPVSTFHLKCNVLFYCTFTFFCFLRQDLTVQTGPEL